MAFNLAGRKFLVTGAGRGIGRALSLALCEQGCKVYAVSLSKGPLESLAAEHANIQPIQADVGNWDELRAKLHDIEPLDGLVNNAALVKFSESGLDVSKEYIEQVMDLQLIGPINTIQMIAKKMIAAKKPGSIVNVSSIIGIRACPQFSVYTISKAGLDMVTKQFALELGPHNIRVNSINPTLVLTDSIKKIIASGTPIDDSFLGQTPMKRLPEVDEIVKPILYLLSDYSSMVSGTVNPVDGGALAVHMTEM